MPLKGHLNNVHIPYFCLWQCTNYSLSHADESLSAARLSPARTSRTLLNKLPAAHRNCSGDELICFCEFYSGDSSSRWSWVVRRFTCDSLFKAVFSSRPKSWFLSRWGCALWLVGCTRACAVLKRWKVKSMALVFRNSTTQKSKKLQCQCHHVLYIHTLHYVDTKIQP